MTSCTTNFTLEELRHIMMAFNGFEEFTGEPDCPVCKEVRKKIETAIELLQIVETEKNARNR
jgi:hydrogenase maturation factor